MLSQDGGGGSGDQPQTRAAINDRRGGTAMAVKDPVCGMEIEEADAVATAEHEGKTYYFCSQDCAEEFANDPASYT